MATRVSNTHPPNGPQATQNQKRETQRRNLEGQKSIICKKNIDGYDEYPSISLLVYIQENLTLRRGGVGSFKTMRAFVPFSVIPVAVSLQKPSFLCFLLVSHQGSKYAI